jgi:hypothetical protein
MVPPALPLAVWDWIVTLPLPLRRYWPGTAVVANTNAPERVPGPYCEVTLPFQVADGGIGGHEIVVLVKVANPEGAVHVNAPADVSAAAATSDDDAPGCGAK